MSSRFPQTSWSVICSLGDSDQGVVREALTVLCRVYWPPLYAFARSRGATREAAEDLTQGFFLHLLERGTLARARAAKGRFRSFLLASFRNYLSHERERESAKKRSPRQPLIPLDIEEAEHAYQRISRLEPADGLTPEELYEQRWAQIVVGRAWKRLENDQRRSGKQDSFVTLQGYLLGDDASVPYGQVADLLGKSVSAVKVAVHRLRREFGKCLQAEVTPTLADPADSADEIRHTLRLIESSRAGLDGIAS